MKISETPKERKYGSVILLGDEYLDRVCLDKTNSATCLNKFKYYLVGESKKRGSYRGMVEPVDGLMGMSRPELPDHYNNKEKLKTPINYTVGDIFYISMAEKHRNDEHGAKVFSFYFTSAD